MSTTERVDDALADRYVAAAVHGLPARQRADIAAELRASIDDQVDARVAAGEEPREAERAVLSALGDPDALAARYEDRPLHLIGPRYYLVWRRLLRMLLAIVVPCAALGVAIGKMLEGASLPELLGAVGSVVVSAAMHVAFWTTLGTALVERHRSSSDDDLPRWSLESLREPEKRTGGLPELIAWLAFLAVAAGAVVWDQVRGWPSPDGPTHALDPSLWPWWTAGLLALLAAEGVLAVLVHVRGGWTMRLAAVNAGLDVVLILGVTWLVVQGRLLAPDLVERLPVEVLDPTTLAVAFGFLVVASAAWDAADSIRRALRA